MPDNDKPKKVYTPRHRDEGDELCPKCDEPFNPLFGHVCKPEDERPIYRGA